MTGSEYHTGQRGIEPLALSKIPASFFLFRADNGNSQLDTAHPVNEPW